MFRSFKNNNNIVCSHSFLTVAGSPDICQMEMKLRKSMTCQMSHMVTLLMYLGFQSRLFPLASVLKMFKNGAELCMCVCVCAFF